MTTTIAIESKVKTPTPALVKEKDQSIETLRGIAIVLMVAGHVIGNNQSNGLRVEDDSAYRHFYYSLQYLRMPLFTVISGFVYAMRPVIAGKVFSFIKGKGRRILLPFVAVGTLQYIVRAMTPGVNQSLDIRDIWTIYPFGFDQFWFLQAIFLAFLVVTVLDRFKWMQQVGTWFGIVLVAVTCCLFFPYLDQNSYTLFGYEFIPSDIFSIDKFIYLLPYFLLGVGLNRFADDLFKPGYVTVAAVVFIAGVICQQLTWYEVLDFDKNRMAPMSLCIGLMGNFLFFRFRPTVPLLAKLGFFAYSIYLFHVFGTAGSRIFASKIGIDNTELLFIISLAFGLGKPIFVELVFLKFTILRRVFLGLR